MSVEAAVNTGRKLHDTLTKVGDIASVDVKVSAMQQRPSSMCSEGAGNAAGAARHQLFLIRLQATKLPVMIALPFTAHAQLLCCALQTLPVCNAFDLMRSVLPCLCCCSAQRAPL